MMTGTDRQYVPTFEEVVWERTTESRISTVISLLPTSLQSRMAPFRPFSRAPSFENMRTSGDPVQSSPSSPRPRSSWEGFITPESEADAHHTPDSPLVLDMIPVDRKARDGQIQWRSGIRWKFVNQGTNLVNIAAETSKDGQSVDFERKAFVDGLTYLLKGLPSNLDTYEAEQIRAALPPHLTTSNIESVRPGAASFLGAPTNLPRSFIHRLVQTLVVNVFVLFHFVLPYIIMLLRSAASVERRYKVSEAVIGHGMNCVNAIGRQCSHLAEIALKGNDSKVGEVVTWAVEEVTRGISDGVGEGLVATRVGGQSKQQQDALGPGTPRR